MDHHHLIAIGYQLLLLKARQEIYALVEQPSRDISHVFDVIERIDQYLKANEWLQDDPRFRASMSRLYNQIPNHI